MPQVTPQLALALEIIAAVVAGVVLLYSRRKDQSKVTKAEKVDSDIKKAKSGKNFCIECGNKLPANLKF